MTTNSTERLPLEEHLRTRGLTFVRSDRLIQRAGMPELSVVLAWEESAQQYIVWYWNHDERYLVEGDYFLVEHSEGASLEERKVNAKKDADAAYTTRRRRNGW